MNAVSEILNKKIAVTISEPADFVSVAGDNVLSGTVKEAGTVNKYGEWLLCEVKPFLYEGKEVTSVAIIGRYQDEDSLIGQILKMQPITVHVLFDPLGVPLTISKLGEALVRQRGLEFLIGIINPPLRDG